MRLVESNKAFAALALDTSPDLSSPPLRDCIPSLWSQIEMPLRQALDAGAESCDIVMTGEPSPDGRNRKWLVSCLPLRADDEIFGAGITLVAVVPQRQSLERPGQDVLVGTVPQITEASEVETRLHQMQSELLHVSRLSAMGQVSSTLTHEINQPLTAVGNYIRAGLLMLDAGDQIAPAKVRGVFEKAAQQAARASAIVRNLREFVRKGDVERRAGNLSIVIQEAMALARLGSRDRGLKVRLQLDSNSRWASFNRVQIQQVLVNLIRNAMEAMADGPRREIMVATVSNGKNLIQISVADSGPGLAENIASDLFKPFITTKPEGMGVGLAICHTIIDAHGGTIWAEPNDDGGTTFHFTLPRAEAGEDTEVGGGHNPLQT